MMKLKWTTERRKIVDLIPAEYNPRLLTDAQAKELRKSLEKFDLVEIPAIDTDGTILAGHQRLSILKTMGREDEEIDVRVPNRKLTDQEAKEYNLRSNKNTGEWDMDKLFAMPEELLREVGFDDKAIQKLIDGHTEAREDDYDVEEGLKLPCSVAKGDIWQLGAHRVMCGDSTAKEDVERLMDGKKAEILFTSPPYSNMRDYGGDNVEVDHLANFISAFEPFSCFQVINLGLQRKDGEIVQYWDEYLSKARESGLKLLSWNVWDKTQGGSIASATAMFMLTHEWIFVFGRKAKDLNRTVANQIEKYESRHGKDFLSGHDGQKVRQKDGSILETTTKCYTHHQLHSCIQQTPELSKIRESHPAIFPIGLPVAYIEAMTNRGQIIVDPFGGSGSTLIACEQTGRVCYGMEILPAYVQVCIDRWEKFTGKKASKISLITEYGQS